VQCQSVQGVSAVGSMCTCGASLCSSNAFCEASSCQCNLSYKGNGKICCDTNSGEQYVEFGKENATCIPTRKVNIAILPFPFDPTVLQVVDEETGSEVTVFGTKDELGMVKSITQMTFNAPNATDDWVMAAAYFDELGRPSHFRDSNGNDLSMAWLSDSVLSVDVSSADGMNYASNDVDLKQLNTTLFNGSLPLSLSRQNRWLQQVVGDDDDSLLPSPRSLIHRFKLSQRYSMV
jgi:hypothetical protein